MVADIKDVNINNQFKYSDKPSHRPNLSDLNR